jgi:hypothetical protein
MVGRCGGARGELFAKNVATGPWKTHRYEVSGKKEALAGNPNWFTVEEFAIRVADTDQSIAVDWRTAATRVAIH